MAYTTHLTKTISVLSRDVRLTRGRTAREHSVEGTPFRARVWEDRLTRTCHVYVNGAVVGVHRSLHAAYSQILDLTQEA